MKFPFLKCLYRVPDPDPRLDAALLRLGEVFRLLRTLTQEIRMIQDKIDELKAVVGEQSTVIGSLTVLMERLLAAAEAAKDDPVELQDVIDKFRANTAEISAAVAKGTAAEGEVPPTA